MSPRIPARFAPAAQGRRLRACTALLLALCTAPALPAEPIGTPIATADGGRYRGPLRDGRFHGQGLLVWESGSRYEGEFERGQMSGRGRLTLHDGSVYRGIFRNGALNGEGRRETPDGEVQEGWFRNGLLHGQGRSQGPDGRYVGAFRDGRFSGRGELSLPDGQQYRGEFTRGRLNGQGHYRSAGGDTYEGQFVEDQFSGTGVYSRADGVRHQGQFLNWQPHGFGRRTEANGDIFEGQFERGELKGRGRILRAGLGDYSGEISNWQPHGLGSLRLENGDRYDGAFAEGYFEGHGTLTLARPRDGLSLLRGQWSGGELRDSAEQRRVLEALELRLYSERERLDQALDALVAGNPADIDLYLLTVAGDGSQEVFRREGEFVRQHFDREFATRGRSLALVNSRESVGEAPIASLTSLRQALQTIGARMDREQDILFLYLTSHGSPQHQLSLTQQAFDLPDLDPAALATMLREAGIRWRVIVISSCYSGGFIEALRDPSTLLITAARHDRRSFGCADENDFTYFGRAYFKDALPTSHSFEEAFRKAQALVRTRERALLEKDGRVMESEYSLPQISAGNAIGEHLGRWWAARESPKRH